MNRALLSCLHVCSSPPPYPALYRVQTLSAPALPIAKRWSYFRSGLWCGPRSCGGDMGRFGGVWPQGRFRGRCGFRSDPRPQSRPPQPPPHAAATPRKLQALLSVSVVVKPSTVSFSDHEGQKQKNKKNHKTKNKTKKDVKIQATTTTKKKYQPNQEASNQVQVHVWRTPAPRELVPQGAPESGFAWLAVQWGRGQALGKT